MTKEEAIAEIKWVQERGFVADVGIVGTDRIIEATKMAIEALEKMKEIEKGIADIEDTLYDAYTLNDLCLNKVVRMQPMSECECIAESFSLKATQNLDWLLGVIERREE